MRVDREPERWQLYGLAAREAGRALWGGTTRALAALRPGTGRPKRLLLAPQDLRTADPTVAGDIYAGHFVFSGRAVSTGGRSPFSFDAPSRAWGEALYGFGWLRHLRAAGTPLAQANARSLVDEFISRNGRIPRRAGEIHVLSRRLISWISQSPLILEGGDHAFYHRFLRAIGRAVRSLRHAAGTHPLPQHRLAAAIGLCYAGLCCDGLDSELRRATRVLSHELERQILPDGGHISRNPQVLVDLLFDLLPLRQMFASRQLDIPEALLHAIDRMLPMLRLFRHGDGTLTHMNGMGVTAADHLATLLSYDDMRSRPIHQAPHSGYQRLEAGRALVIADVGSPPPVNVSASAGAGCLSFEFSSGPHRIIVNCGLPRTGTSEVIRIARSTPAHSTASVERDSSCRFLERKGAWWDRLLAGWVLRRLGPVVVSGPGPIAAERNDRDQVLSLDASHDGYRARHGLVHERRWQLAGDGHRLEGEDHFASERPLSEDLQVELRFHLAPGIRVSRAEGGRIVSLMLPNREAWRFEAAPTEPQIEDSVFFSATEGPRRTQQIVLKYRLAATPSVRWRFERLDRAPEAAVAENARTPELL
jgi:uncharacterized heparinase superfamily protein